jgi:hypothetical protein
VASLAYRKCRSDEWIHKARGGNVDLGDSPLRDIDPEDMKPPQEASKAGKIICSARVSPGLVPG